MSIEALQPTRPAGPADDTIGALAAVVYDDVPEARAFLATLSTLHTGGTIHVETSSLVHRRVDDRIGLSGCTSAAQSGFWGLLVGLALWPQWLGIVPTLPGPAAATVTDWGLSATWVEDVASSMGPGDAAAVFIARDVPPAVVELVRTTAGDLFQAPLAPRARRRLSAAFGGADAHVDPDLTPG